MSRRASGVPKEHRCQALTRDSWGRPTNDRCPNHSYVQAGKWRLCARHAALYLLNECIRTADVKILPHARQPPNKNRFVGKDEV